MEEPERGEFWCVRLIDISTRLRWGRAVAKTESEAAEQVLKRLRQTTHPHAPPPFASDAGGGYREAIVKIWGQVPEYQGKGRPRKKKQAPAETMYLQVKKKRSGSRLLKVETEVVYGDPEEVTAILGAHTAYIERTHLTSRQMNGRLVRKTLSFSKKLRCLRASCVWEDLLYNWTREVKTLRQPSSLSHRKWDPTSPAMAAGLADHLWDVEHLLRSVVSPSAINTD